jgi:hypothetical protein
MTMTFDSITQAEQFKLEMTGLGYTAYVLSMNATFHQVRCWKR